MVLIYYDVGLFYALIIKLIGVKLPQRSIELVLLPKNGTVRFKQLRFLLYQFVAIGNSIPCSDKHLLLSLHCLSVLNVTFNPYNVIAFLRPIWLTKGKGKVNTIFDCFENIVGNVAFAQCEQMLNFYKCSCLLHSAKRHTGLIKQ